MNTDLRRSVTALTAAGLLWGSTVPLSKVALEWLPPAWLTFARFAVAAAILLFVARDRLRTAWSPAVLAWGALGYGGTVLVQNAGITKTSVSHAALLIGATPVLVAVVAALWRRTVAPPVAWAGFVLSLIGVGLVAGGAGGGATVSGDGLVLLSLLISATFTVAQTGLLRGRDPVAVTAVQFLAAACAMLPVAVAREGMPAFPGSPGSFLAFVVLALGGTVLPFALFAYGQARVSAVVAGAFLNLEPLVGAVAGAVLFSNPVGAAQVLGGAAILAGIGLSSLPLLTVRRRPVAQSSRASQSRALDEPRALDELRALDESRALAPSRALARRPTPSAAAQRRPERPGPRPGRTGPRSGPPASCWTNGPGPTRSRPDGRGGYRLRCGRCSGLPVAVTGRTGQAVGSCHGPVQRGGKGSFEDQQPALDLNAGSAAVTAQPVRGHHPVARHDDRYRIGSHELADGPGGHGHAARARRGPAGQRPVGDRLAEAHRIDEHPEHL